MSHAMQGHPRQTGHSEEFWQNVIHWRRVWQTTPVCLPQEPHELYEKAKRYEHQQMSSAVWKGSNMLLEKSRERLLIAPERKKQLGQSRNYAWLWMYLVVKVKSAPVKNNIAYLLQPSIFPSIRAFQMSQLFASGGQILEFQLQHQSFQWIFRTDFL